mmetsp:Transcript_58540/g.130874  ORF Transcript_58540/g.130874 Transcript_58540/m.130874 type:complete len:563 (+) Transcript_58540:111-1799(+)
MRVYTRQKSCWFVRNLIQMEGSVFPTGFMVSMPSAALAGLLFFLHDREHLDNVFNAAKVDERVFANSSIWSGFTFLVGFLTVFRTSHAYNRFWEACASVHKMGAEWFDSCSAVIAYTKVSKCSSAEVLTFQNKVIRLFSMLHAVALAELEDLDNGTEELEVRSFEMELIDAGAFDDDTLAAVRDSTCRVELVYQWIQSLIVEANTSGVLGVPPPILTRSFQELSGGMVCFHDAMKVADTPFPFPYLQTCDALLLVMYLASPVVTSTYCSTWWLAAFFCFTTTFTFTCLTLTALELEFPFGRDANDIQGVDLQDEMNHKLRLLVSGASWKQPCFHSPKEPQLDEDHQAALLQNISGQSYVACHSLSVLWSRLPEHKYARRWAGPAQLFPNSHPSIRPKAAEGPLWASSGADPGSAFESDTEGPDNAGIGGGKPDIKGGRSAKIRARRMRKSSPLFDIYIIQRLCVDKTDKSGSQHHRHADEQPPPANSVEHIANQHGSQVKDDSAMQSTLAGSKEQVPQHGRPDELSQAAPSLDKRRSPSVSAPADERSPLDVQLALNDCIAL